MTKKRTARAASRARAGPAARARRAAPGPSKGAKASKSSKVSKARAAPTVFISYRHANPTAAIAKRLFTALVPASEVWNADVFMDQHALEPADLFDQAILAALDRTTHFIVLLTNDYWSSDYCRKELARVVERFEKDRSVRLLFVKVEELDPAYFTLAKDRTSGRIKSANPVIQRIGDVQFLGPFNEVVQLVRLEWENPAKLGDQIAQLVKRLGQVIHK